MIVRDEQMKTVTEALGQTVMPCSVAEKGALPLKAPGPPVPDVEKEDEEWIEIQVFDTDKKPVSGVWYKIHLTDGSTKSGATDANGLAGYYGIPSGNCDIVFPDFDQFVLDKQ